MPEKKILLNEQTQFTNVQAFFAGLDDKDRVRARSCEGGVELYVRGSSKWHVFTDLLRLASDVQKDYKEAQNKLFSIFDNSPNGPISNIQHDLSKLKKVTKEHKHDFRASQFNSYFQDVAKAKGKFDQEKRLQSEAQSRLDSAWKGSSFTTQGKNWLKDHVEALLTETALSNPSENAELQRQANEFSTYVASKVDTNVYHKAIDYVAAENFAFSWKKISAKIVQTAADDVPNIKEKPPTPSIEHLGAEGFDFLMEITPAKTVSTTRDQLPEIKEKLLEGLISKIIKHRKPQ